MRTINTTIRTGYEMILHCDDDLTFTAVGKDADEVIFRLAEQIQDFIHVIRIDVYKVDYIIYENRSGEIAYIILETLDEVPRYFKHESGMKISLDFKPFNDFTLHPEWKAMLKRVHDRHLKKLAELEEKKKEMQKEAELKTLAYLKAKYPQA